MIDRTKAEWLFYRSIYRTAVGKDEWDDEKWIDLRFPHKEEFCNQLLESSTEDFVRTLVWIFKDRYPIEFSGLETSMWGLDEEGVPDNELVNTRKLQDIEPMIVESEVFRDVNSVTIRFKQEQSNVFTWIETELEGKPYTKEGNSTVTYHVVDSPIERIEATENGFRICVRETEIIY